MATNYPGGIDGYAQLPYVTDKVTEISAITVNRLRDAIVAVQGELGIEPSGDNSTVKDRLDAIESSSSELTDHASTHINGGTDVIFGDRLRVTYTPSNYTRTTSPAEASTLLELSAHLAGIDDKILEIEDDIAEPSIPLAHASSHIKGGADEIDGDKIDIDYSPSIYTPSTAPSSVSNVDHLSAHLDGIDLAIGRLTPSYSSVFYVDPDSDYGDYTTIQAAINAADAGSPTLASPAIIFIKPGTYTENLTFYANIFLFGLPYYGSNFATGSFGPPISGKNVRVVATDQHTGTGSGPFDAFAIQNIVFYRSATSTNPMIELSSMGILMTDCILYETESTGSANQGPIMSVSEGFFIDFRDSTFGIDATTTSATDNNGAIEININGANSTVKFTNCVFQAEQTPAADTTFVYGGIVSGGEPGRITFKDCDGQGVYFTTVAGDHLFEIYRSEFYNIEIHPSEASLNGNESEIGLRARWSDFKNITFNSTGLTNYTSVLSLSSCTYDSIPNSLTNSPAVEAKTIKSVEFDDLTYANISGPTLYDVIIDIDEEFESVKSQAPSSHSDTHEFNGSDEIDSDLLKASYVPSLDGNALGRYSPIAYQDFLGDGYDDGYSDSSIGTGQLGAHLNGINRAFYVHNGIIVEVTGTPSFTPDDEQSIIVVNNYGGSPATINLPLAVRSSSNPLGHITGRITIKDSQGDASSANISIYPSGSNTIDGSSGPYVINADYASITLIYNHNSNDWIVT